MDKKYYFLVYRYSYKGEQRTIENTFTNKNPFQWQIDANAMDGSYRYVLMDYKEVDKETYDRFNDHFG